MQQVLVGCVCGDVCVSTPVIFPVSRGCHGALSGPRLVLAWTVNSDSAASMYV